MACTPTLPALNDDIVVSICEQAGPRTTARLSCVSRELYRMAGHPHLWRRFYAQHIGPVPAQPCHTGRRAFAEQVPAAAKRLAVQSCLGNLDAADIFLVAFPNEADTPRFCVDLLAQAASAMDRQFRLLDAARLSSLDEPANLGPSDFCVFENVEAAHYASVQTLYSLIEATKLAPGRKIVLLHGENLDCCDGGLTRRVPHQLIYQVVPTNFPIDPVAATL
jgi:hypothetical protein